VRQQLEQSGSENKIEENRMAILKKSLIGNMSSVKKNVPLSASANAQLAKKASGLTASKAGMTASKTALTASKAGLTASKAGLTASKAGLTASKAGLTASKAG
jgi:hypothetical protein